MKAVLSVISLCVIGLASADVASKFREAKIEPNVINKAPTEFIEVEYGDVRVNLGKEIKPAEAASSPIVIFNSTESVLYTLLMLDSPTPTGTQVKHWLIGNIRDGCIFKGETIADYLGPGPPKDTGLHPYIFLIYEQKQGVIAFDESDREDRKPFYTREFVEKHNLGDPVGGNFFVAQYQPAVKK